MWPDRRLIDLFKTEFPIVLAPMAGVDGRRARDRRGAGRRARLAALRDDLGGEGARAGQHHPPARLGADQHELLLPHSRSTPIRAREAGWKQRLAAYYKEFGLDPAAPINAANRAPFDAAMCEVVEELKPEVVSFHFGLPEPALLKRVKAAGCIVMSSATTVKEAIWLEENGADAIIAQGAEAGGHRGMFLTENIAEQPGTFALVPQVVDAVKVPVIAAGGIADGRGIAAAFALGASGVQIGTRLSALPGIEGDRAGARGAGAGARRFHRHHQCHDRAAGARRRQPRDARGRPDLAGCAGVSRMPRPRSGPLKAAAEKLGRVDFTNLWAGQAVRLGREMPAAELTRALAGGALARLSQMAG